MRDNIGLSVVCDSLAKAKIIDYFCSGSETSFNEYRLSKKVKLSPSTVATSMRDLTSTGIVDMERCGKQRVYQVNKKRLKGIFENLQKEL